MAQQNTEQNPELVDNSPEPEAPQAVEDSAIIRRSTQKPPAMNDDEVFSLPTNLINYVVVALLFFFIGISVDNLLSTDESLDESTLRIVLNEALSASGINETAVNASDMVDNDPYIGPEDAPVVIIEFSDFLCQFCGRHFEETLQPLLEEYEGYIRYVYRDFPGVGGNYAYISAMAAECAHDQGMFWEYHDALFSNRESLASADIENILIGYAEELTLDMETFTPCLQNQTHMGDVIIDLSDGESVGVTGTPGFLINGRLLSGARPYEVFAALIDNELEKAGIVMEDDGSA